MVWNWWYVVRADAILPDWSFSTYNLLKLTMYCLLLNCCGVPQGSVLGPLLSTMYSTPLISIITAFGLKHRRYPDDTQIYTSFVAKNITQSIVVQNCKLTIQVWMDQNMHTPIMYDHWKFNTTWEHCSHISCWSSRPKFWLKRFYTKPGCGFDPAFSFQKHIWNICKSAFYHIRNLRIHPNKAYAAQVTAFFAH